MYFNLPLYIHIYMKFVKAGKFLFFLADIQYMSTTVNTVFLLQPFQQLHSKIYNYTLLKHCC